ncbi:hypothetical protein QUA43_29460 [Microcoleus sp. N9_B4]
MGILTPSEAQAGRPCHGKHRRDARATDMIGICLVQVGVYLRLKEDD